MADANSSRLQLRMHKIGLHWQGRRSVSGSLLARCRGIPHGVVPTARSHSRFRCTAYILSSSGEEFPPRDSPLALARRLRCSGPVDDGARPKRAADSQSSLLLDDSIPKGSCIPRRASRPHSWAGCFAGPMPHAVRLRGTCPSASMIFGTILRYCYKQKSNCRRCRTTCDLRRVSISPFLREIMAQEGSRDGLAFDLRPTSLDRPRAYIQHRPPAARLSRSSGSRARK